MAITFDKRLLNRKFRFLLNEKYNRPMTILKGGSSSGKTYNLSQVVPMWILAGHNILIARESGATLRRSIFAEIEKAIMTQGLTKFFTIRYTNLTIESRVSNGSALFVATSDEEKLKSITPRRSSAFDICIMEEASEISFNSQQQLKLRMRGKTEFAMKRVYMLLNPIARSHHIYKTYYEPLDNPDNTGYVDDKMHLHHSTYLDNPYLDTTEKEVLEGMAEISPRHHEVYALGMWGTMTKTVYSNWEAMEVSFEDISHLNISIGLDWGHVHPMGVSFTAHDPMTNTLIVFDEIRIVGENFDELWRQLGDKIDEYSLHSAKIHCDPAEPRSIQMTAEKGFRVVKAWKPAGSVLAGIDWMQRQKIVINKRNCPYTLAELSAYSWKERDGQPIDEVIKENDDLMDAMRYGRSDEIRGFGGVRYGSKRGALGWG